MISLISCSSSTSAQSIKKVRLNANKIAPFSGILLSDAALAKVITDAEAETKKLKLRIEYLEKVQNELIKNERAVCKAKLDAETKKLKLTEDACKLEKKILHGAVNRTTDSCNRSWYESPVLGFLVGMITTGGIVVGTIAGTK